MSMTFSVYVTDVDDSLTPKWINELNKLGMTCEIHPDFSFITQTGFLPFKLNVSNHSHQDLMSKDCLSGFEFYIQEFDINNHTGYLKQSFFEKLLKKPKQWQYFHSEEIDGELKDKKFEIIFNFGSSDTFELRMAFLASATLSIVADGKCCYSDDDIWYDNATVIEDALKEVSEYEKGLKPREFCVHEFKKWE